MGWFFKLASVWQKAVLRPKILLRGCYAPPPKGEAKHATSKFVDCGYDWATGKMGALKSVFICPASHRGVSLL